ncbi:MAG: hypothetical protein ACTS10_21905 [Kiloniellales bacterium]
MIPLARRTPIQERFTTMEDGRPATPVEALFCAVIDLALRDAAEIRGVGYVSGNRTSLQRMQDEARNWLLSGGRDFHLICDLAGRDPAEVREQAERLLNDPELCAAYAGASRVGSYRKPRAAPTKGAAT